MRDYTPRQQYGFWLIHQSSDFKFYVLMPKLLYSHRAKLYPCYCSSTPNPEESADLCEDQPSITLNPSQLSVLTDVNNFVIPMYYLMVDDCSDVNLSSINFPDPDLADHCSDRERCAIEIEAYHGGHYHSCFHDFP